MRFILILTTLCLVSAPIYAQEQPKEPKTEKKAEKKAEPKKPDATKSKPLKPKTDAKSTQGKAISLSFDDRKAKTLFPVTEEGRRTYTLTTSKKLIGAKKDDDSNVSNAVMDLILGTSELIEGVKFWVLEWRVNGETRQKELVRFAEDRLLCRRRIFGPERHARIFDIEAPQIILPAQVKPGLAWEWNGKSGKVSGATESKILREEEIMISKKAFPCVVVRVLYTGEDGSKGLSTRWYSPRVGLVKEVLEVKTQTEKFTSKIVLKVAEKQGTGK